ncbi:MAG TPA: hypothetical protein VJ124_05290 [Pyrinomonadaceae bacterium]|nr:hypothetical protein [Pyrinomonadaceae bacterium]
MTRKEFEQGYAERSGVTVEWLHEQNQHAIPCDCGDDLCKGWQMVNIFTEMFEEDYAASRLQ